MPTAKLINSREYWDVLFKAYLCKLKKSYLLIGLMGLLSCTGSMTKEQRDKMLKARESTEIKKISESAIHEVVLKRGIQVTKEINLTDNAAYDALEKKMKCKIHWISVNSINLDSIDSEIIQAYKQTSSSLENVQKINGDSILYTKSEFDQQSNLKGMWRISFSKKDLIQSM
jgi:hypothetical protein